MYNNLGRIISFGAGRVEILKAEYADGLIASGCSLFLHS